MNSAEIKVLLVSDPSVYLHYTDETGHRNIFQEGLIRANYKGAVYFSQTPFDQEGAHTCLFIGAPSHIGRGSHVLVMRLDPGLRLDFNGFHEFRASQNIRLDQHEVLYAGKNPF